VSAAANRSGIDVFRYPRTAAYVRQLPEGLDSYPDCVAKASIHRTVYAHYTSTNEALTGLPAPLQARLDDPSPAAKWIPQCHTLALILAIVESRGETRGLDGPEMGAWIREAAASLFSTPMYRILMLAATPRLLFKGANIRWSAFFRGSELRPDMGDHEATVELSAPPGMFDVTLATIFTDVLRAALNLTEEQSDRAQIELVSVGHGSVHYHGMW
jgi:hypothetical protein